TVLFSVGRYPFTTAQAVGLIVIAALTWINITGLKSGAMVQNVFTIAKVAAIAVLLILAVASGKGSAAHCQPLIGAALGPEVIKRGLCAAGAPSTRSACGRWRRFGNSGCIAPTRSGTRRWLPGWEMAGSGRRAA